MLSSVAQSRRGRITTRMGTTDITDTDHIPITDPPAAACGTVTPGYPLVSYELDGGGGFAIFTAIRRASSLLSASERQPIEKGIGKLLES